MATPDFFTPIYQAVWAALRAYAPLAAFVKAGNQGDFTVSVPNTIKEPLRNPGDTPFLKVTPCGFRERRDMSNSMVTFYEQDVAIEATTANLSIQATDQMKTMVYIALTQSGQSLGMANGWGWKPLTGRESPKDQQAGQKQWNAVALFSVIFYVQNNVLANL